MSEHTPGMDSGKTAPFELGQGDDACLLVHGFTGSPWDMRPLGEALAARGLYVKALRLPGHGTTPEALLHVGQKDWEEATAQALRSLQGFRQVFVAGLSLGALLSVGLAARFPTQVHGLVLIAPAARFKGPKMFLLKRLRRSSLLEWVKPWVHKRSTDICDPVARAEAPILPAFPTVRLKDLWALQEAAAQQALHVRCPTLVAVAEQDHVVDPEGGRWLARQLTHAPAVHHLSLRDGYHIIPRDLGGPLLASEVGNFLDRLRNWSGGEHSPSAKGEGVQVP